jgi:5'-AMP-activated protein kinase regulatory beta subunit
LEERFGLPPLNSGIPVPFRWAGTAKQVCVALHMDDYRVRIPLSRSTSDFNTIVELPPGVHFYRFWVDGKWRSAADQASDISPDGHVANMVQVAPVDMYEPLEPRGSPPGEYGQLLPPPPADERAEREPALLPPHLHRALLNCPPLTADPATLPVPQHVQLNHLYSALRTDGVLLLGLSHRYRSKFVTTVFYRHGSLGFAASPAK